ncbi:hypothetical protein [Trueperella sp. LYQ143]|uniref:hypothetical protein n=1 Tax=Trueperella sp. LYQ143 TaxID=3391059 RepID=UPI0039832D9B
MVRYRLLVGLGAVVLGVFPVSLAYADEGITHLDSGDVGITEPDPTPVPTPDPEPVVPVPDPVDPPPVPPDPSEPDPLPVPMPDPEPDPVTPIPSPSPTPDPEPVPEPQPQPQPDPAPMPDPTPVNPSPTPITPSHLTAPVEEGHSHVLPRDEGVDGYASEYSSSRLAYTGNTASHGLVYGASMSLCVGLAVVVMASRAKGRNHAF